MSVSSSRHNFPVSSMLIAAVLACLVVLAAQAAGPYPLQELTARTAAGLMAPWIEVTRHGTLLKLASVEIAVTQDCAGFNAITVLAPMLLLWGALNRVNLLFMSALLVPICLAANTVRVLLITLLAVTGDVSLAMGKLHTVSGLATFGLSLLLGMQAGLLWNRYHQHLHQYIYQKMAGTIPMLLTLGSFGLILAWNMSVYLQSPLDAWLAPLLITGLGLVWVVLKQSRPARSLRTGPIAAAFALILLGLVTQIQLLWLTGVLAVGVDSLAARTADHPGLRLTLLRRILLITVCVFFSLPGLLQFLVPVIPDSAVSLVYISVFLAAIIGLTCLNHLRRVPVNTGRALVFTACLCGAAAITLNTFIPAGTPVPGNDPHLPYTLADWTGNDVPLLLTEESLFRGAKLTKREYRSDLGHVFLLEVTSSDRRDIHPPQYCYSSAGWVLTAIESDADLSLFTAESATGASQLVGYFVESGGRIYPGQQLLLVKLKSLLRGSNADWRMIRLATPDDSGARQRLAAFSERLVQQTF